MTLPSLRKTYVLSLMATLLALAFVYYLEIYQNLEPCPLCILQRLALFFLSGLFLLGSMVRAGSKIQYLISASCVLVGSGGWLVVARQVWLQYSPMATVGDCSVSLHYMLQTFPFQEVLQKLFQSNADCANIDWKLLSISLAAWSLIFFTGLCCIILKQGYRLIFNR